RPWPGSRPPPRIWSPRRPGPPARRSPPRRRPTNPPPRVPSGVPAADAGGLAKMTDNILRCATVDEFAAWLEANHPTATEVWLALPKKGTAVPSVSRSEALDVALCYGWIDGKAFSGNVSDGWWAQRFSPRRARSPWSKINCARVEQLIAKGRMRPAGLAQVEQARADGRWAAAIAPPSAAETP